MLQVPSLSVDVHSTDPLRDFCGSLRRRRSRLGRPARRHPAVGGRRCIDGYPAADAPQRRDALRAIARDHAAGRAGDHPGSRPPRNRYCRRPCCTRTSGATRRSPSDEQAWHRLAAQPLTSLERILPTFDITLPQKLTLKGFFLARYGRGGRCDDLLKLVHDFHEDFYDEYLQGDRRAPAFRRHRRVRTGTRLARPAGHRRDRRGPAGLRHADPRALGGTRHRRRDRADRIGDRRRRRTGCHPRRTASPRSPTSCS